MGSPRVPSLHRNIPIGSEWKPAHTLHKYHDTEYESILNMAARSMVAAVWQTKPAAAAASRPGEKMTDRSIDRSAHTAGHKK